MALNIAILLSGFGSNFQAIQDKIDAGVLHARICLVASNKPEAKGLERAHAAGLATWSQAHQNYPSRETFDAALGDALEASGVELIVLAGYMRLLSKSFLDRFNGRVINIHPALLPSFPGVQGAVDAVAYGVKISGVTVHFVEEIMDSGPVIIQAAVPCIPGESATELQARIYKQEHRIYPQAIEWFAQKRISLGADGRMVHLAPGPAAPALVESGVLVYPPLEQGF
jgi:phosphoribosylglycinamide formyltransferase-1